MKLQYRSWVIICFLCCFFIVFRTVLGQDRESFLKKQENATVTGEETTQLSVLRQNVCAQNTTFYEFSNGLTLFVREENSSAIGAVRFYVRKTGLLNEGNRVGSGISHLLERLILEGPTRSRTPQEIKNTLTQLGGVEESFTGPEMSGFSIVCPSESLLEALDLLSDQIQNTEIDQNGFVTMKYRIKREIEHLRNNAVSSGRALLMQTCYLEHPFRHPEKGYPELLENLSRDDLFEFYQNRYTPNQLVIAVVGRINPSVVASKVCELFQDKVRCPEPEIPLAFEPEQTVSRLACQEWNGKTFELFQAWPTVVFSDKDKYALDLWSKILTGGENALLVRQLQNQRRLLLTVDSLTVNPSSVKGLLGLKFSVLPANVETLRSALREEIEQIQTNVISNVELSRAKKRCATEFIYKRQKIQDAVDLAVQQYLLTGNPDYDDSYLEAINKITPEELRLVAQKYFRAERLNEVLICPKGMIPKSVPENKTEKNKLAPAVQAFKLNSNGFAFLVKRVPESPIVNIQFMLLAGTLFDKEENAGRSALLAEMFKRGSEELKRNALAEFFDNIGGQWKITSGRNSIIFSATVLREDFPNALRMMAGILLHPAFSKDDYSDAKETVLARIAQRHNYVTTEVLERFTENISDRSPLHFLPEGSAESIQKIALPDVIRFYHERLTASNLIVTVYGGVETEQAKDLLTKTFEKLPKTPSEITNPFDHPNDLIAPVERHYKTDHNSAAGVVAWPTASILNKEDYAALLILQTILGGYRQPNGILYETLWENGLVWDLKVEQMRTPVPGWLYVCFETPQEHLSDVILQIKKGMERIINGAVSQEDFNRSKEEVLAGLMLQEQTMENEARQTGLNCLYGLKVGERSELRERIRKLSSETVFAVARKYTGQNLVVTVSPMGTIQKK